MTWFNPTSLLLLASVLYCSVSARVQPDISVNESIQVFESAHIFPTSSIIIVGSNNEKCREDSRILMENLRNSTTWAMQMLDASAKGIEGQLIGSFYQFGNFFECVKAVTPIRAQYCLATLTLEPPPTVKFSKSAEVFYNPLGPVWNKIWHLGDRERVPRNTIHQAMCVPASCSHTDVEASIRRHLEVSSLNRNYSVDVHPSFCQTNRSEEKLSTGSIVYCCIMATVLLLVVVSTICDRNKYSTQDEEPSDKLESKRSNGYVTMFSLKRNLYHLWKPSEGRFQCINGMKFVSTCFVLFAHRTFIQLGGPFYNYEDFERGKLTFNIGIFMQLETVVDSFFVISGMLLTFTLLRLSEKKAVNPILVILMRYLRFTPVYVAIIFFYTTLMYHAGQGPLWTAIIARERQFCQENWWTNLLYINNYVNDGRMCMIHSWYMAPEFHMFIVTTFLVYIIRRCPILGYPLLCLTIVASLLTPFVITLMGHLDPVQFFNADEFSLERTQPYFQQMYTKTHVHATPYLVGIVAGLVLFRKRSHQTKYTWQSTVGMLAGSLVCIGSLLPGCFMTSHIWQYNDIEAAMIQSQRRFFWPLGVAMILFSLIFSKNSLIERFLSSRVMSILSHLCYTAYLSSLCLQLILAGRILAPSPLFHSNNVISAITDIVLTFFASLLLYLTVEAPFANLLSKVLGKGRRRS